MSYDEILIGLKEAAANTADKETAQSWAHGLLREIALNSGLTAKQRAELVAVYDNVPMW